MKLLGFVLGLVLVSGLAAQDHPSRRWIDAGAAVPVAAQGRVLPLETWSQVIYSTLSGIDRSPDALGWLERALVQPAWVAAEPVFLVNDPQVTSGTTVQLAGRGRYSPQDLEPLFALAPGWLHDFADDVSPPGKERVRLARALLLYQSLVATFGTDGPAALASPFRVIAPSTSAWNPAQAYSGTPTPAEKDRLALLLFWVERSRAGDWLTAAEALETFAGHAVESELWYSRTPWAGLAAVVGVLALGLIWAFRSRTGVVVARVVPPVPWLLVTLWLGWRIVLTGHPPVTNLASTFVLVSWFCFGASAFLAWRPAWAAASTLALAAGSLLPLISLAVTSGSDPLAPVQAVLNTNFWLSIHVTTIIAGYTATLGAGLVGHAYLVASLGKGGSRSLETWWKLLHGLLVAALVLTLAGTLLGGIWADQSWGRFWGWDPKEDGALLILLWLALTLHLRPSGWAQEWGTAVAASFLLLVLLFSWLGVNLLGLGFHSYGAAPGRVTLFLGLVAADLLVLAALVVRKVLR